MRPYATSVCGLKLLAYGAVSCICLEQVRQGFEELVPREVIEQTFSARELEAVLIGSGDVDVADWRANSVATGFRPSAPQVLLFFSFFFCTQIPFFFWRGTPLPPLALSPPGSTGFFFCRYVWCAWQRGVSRDIEVCEEVRMCGMRQAVWCVCVCVCVCVCMLCSRGVRYIYT
jgi:hypothetical protein